MTRIIIDKSTGKKDDSFVGFRIMDGVVKVYLPLMYDLYVGEIESKDIGPYRDDILRLFGTFSLSKNSSLSNDEILFSSEGDSELLINSYVWLIKDYLSNGVPFVHEKRMNRSRSGKILWKKTIQLCRPIINKDSVIYVDSIRLHSCGLEDIISEAYRYCLNESVMNIGWLFDLKPNSDMTGNFSVLKKEVYRYEVVKKLNESFESLKKVRLHHMLNIISTIKTSKLKKNVQYGVDNFEYIFEKMIDDVYGTEKTNMYRPSGEYHICGDIIKSTELYPDTIIKDDINFYVIDSKYYTYALSGGCGSLPTTDSIQKQITYADNIKKRYGDANIYNSFILPYNMSDYSNKTGQQTHEILYIGFATASWREKQCCDNISVILIDLKYLIEVWYHRLDSHVSELKSLIERGCVENTP